MTLEINKEVEDIINNKLLSGMYSSTDNLIREAIASLEEKENFKKYVNNAISKAEESIINGDVMDDAQLNNFIENLILSSR